MKNRIISILLIALTLSSILCFSINAEDISPYWINTSSVTCNLMFSGSTGYISASVDGKSGTSRIEGTVTVYRKTGTIWIGFNKGAMLIQYCSRFIAIINLN